MTAFQDYLLSPLAPLVFRAGTPFGGTDTALTADFPSPSTLAGALRAAARRSSTDPESNAQPVHGPLLVEMGAGGGGQSEGGDAREKRNGFHLKSPLVLRAAPKATGPEPRRQASVA